MTNAIGEMPPKSVTAKTRKRCPWCNKMVEIGQHAVLTDDRMLDTKSQWFGAQYMRGAFHLHHAACYEDRKVALAAFVAEQTAAALVQG